ncbi:hypothetical protein RRG08_056381 [Elysia crispata]|uniref:Uncharacterized protein n=1 Tax=Elysia crispata TaxID=231223 RepID=A0AAE0ZY43_9GAST|nr:hypothetical protein RRG08_056381 [Elysia crispata]
MIANNFCVLISCLKSFSNIADTSDRLRQVHGAIHRTRSKFKAQRKSKGHFSSLPGRQDSTHVNAAGIHPSGANDECVHARDQCHKAFERVMGRRNKEMCQSVHEYYTCIKNTSCPVKEEHQAMVRMRQRCGEKS